MTTELHSQRHMQQGSESSQSTCEHHSVNSALKLFPRLKKILNTKIKPMLVFSQPERGRLCVIPSPLLLTKPFLPVVFGQIPEPLKTPLSPFMCSQATKRARTFAIQPQKGNGVNMLLSEGGKKIHLLLLPSSKISWIIFLFASFSL